MGLVDAAPTFPENIVFPDVDAATLAREDRFVTYPRAVIASAWNDYLQKVLPPVNRQPRPELRMLSGMRA